MFFTKTAVAALLAFASVSSALTGAQEFKRDLETREASVNANTEFDHLSLGEGSEDLSKRTAPIDVYIAFGNRRKPKDALHWMIVTAEEGSNSATYWHVTGGPTQGKPFKPDVQAGKRLDSNGIASKTKIGSFAASDLNKFKAAVKAAPVPGSGQNCQNYVVSMLTKLEAKGFVHEGTAATYAAKIEKINKEKTPPPESSTSEIVDGTK
jgi:hypothetical protein